MNAAVPALSRVYRNQCEQCPDRNTYVIIQHCSHCIPHLNAQLVCEHQSFVPKLVRLYLPDVSNFARLFASCLGQYHQIIGVNPHIERHQGLLHTKRMHVVFASHQARQNVLNGGDMNYPGMYTFIHEGVPHRLIFELPHVNRAIMAHPPWPQAPYFPPPPPQNLNLPGVQQHQQNLATNRMCE